MNQNVSPMMDDTKYLLDDSTNTINISRYNSKLNNTQILLDDKTSILQNKNDSNISREIFRIQNSLLNEGETIKKGEDLIAQSNLTRSFDDILSLSKTENVNYSSQSKEQASRMLPELEYNEVKDINFGMLFPTEVKKKTIKIKNTSSNPCSLFLKISEAENLKEYFPQYNEICNNSNIIHSCIKIANQNSKVSLIYNEVTEICIEIKCPYAQRRENLFFLLEVYNNNFLDKAIPITACVEVPKFCCLRSVLGVRTGSTPVLPVRIELQSKGQKYRIPFRNFSLRDMEVSFIVNKTNNNSDFYISKDNQLFKFYFIFFPNVLIVPPQSTCYVNMVIKVSLEDKINENINQNNIKQRRKIRKVVSANIVNTEISYTLLINGIVHEM